MTAPTWRERLQQLVDCYPQYGIGPDLAAMTVAELWALFRFLSRVAGVRDGY